LEGCPPGRGGRRSKNYFSLPYNPKLRSRARELRKAGNLSEVLLWNCLKNRQFKGFDFDRQKIIGNFIVDFYCVNRNVVLEIDGSSHDDKIEYDDERDTFLTGLGLTVIHIQAKDVLHRLDGVMEMLKEHPMLGTTPALRATPPKEGNLRGM
jgi:very-short-patch-repair endonuclease